MPNLLNRLAAPSCTRLDSNWVLLKGRVIAVTAPGRGTDLGQDLSVVQHESRNVALGVALMQSVTRFKSSKTPAKYKETAPRFDVSIIASRYRRTAAATQRFSI